MTTGRDTVSAQLLQQAVDTAADFFPHLVDGLSRVAQALSEDRLADGLNLFVTAQDGLKWFCNMVELREVWLGTGRRKTALDEAWPSFVEIVSYAAEALGRGDYVYLGDLILYEIIPFIEKVQDAVRERREEWVCHAV